MIVAKIETIVWTQASADDRIRIMKQFEKRVHHSSFGDDFERSLMVAHGSGELNAPTRTVSHILK